MYGLQYYLLNTIQDGRLIQKLTKGNWEVTKLLWIRPKAR